MPSFKQKKDIENSAFPIERLVREIRDFNKDTISKMFWQLAGIGFSGIGTSISLQDEYLPRFVKCVLNVKEPLLNTPFRVFR